MPRIQFAAEIVDLNGLPVEEPVKNGFIKEVHKTLKQFLVDTGKCPEAVLASFDGLCAATKVLTVGDVCCRALGAAQNGHGGDVKKLVEQYDLIGKIAAAEKKLEPLDLDVDTLSDLRKAVAAMPGSKYPLMQACKALEGNVPSPTPEPESQPKA